MKQNTRTNLSPKYGPWAVVTGASSGIGRALAVELAAGGLKLVLVARQRGRLEELATELKVAYGTEVRVMVADLSRPEEVEQVVRSTSDLETGLLVAAAGFGTSGEFLSADLSTELEMLDVNCRAVAALSHAFGGRFAARGRGGIILMSSLVGFQGVPRAAHYAATKAYVQTFAEGLQRELAPRGVDVLASAPGPVNSGFAERAGMRMSGAASPEEVARGTVAALGRRGTVRPGLLSMALEAALSPLPRWARTTIMARVMGGMTAHRP
ncbi:MAG: SDR family oxidoreductase [Meiothermus sp.]|nr:SDR family oxidoreductase [Meiothermus sp.]